MKYISIMFMSLFSFLGLGSSAKKVYTGPPVSFYDFKMKTIDGKDFDFHQLKGKRVMIVNTASECGFTPQYEDLEKVYKAYGGDKFVILGFPANNFGAQEPGTNTEIAAFCKKNYGVTFQMFEKISVKGDDTNDLYKWLCNKSMNKVSDATVKWNFNKFLIDENGNWVSWLSSRTKPDDAGVIEWIKTGKKSE